MPSTPFHLIGPDTDREATTEALAAAFAERTSSSVKAQMYAAQDRLAPAFEAADLGHAVTFDPPSGLSSIRSRWTCQICGRAVLHAQAGHMYGTAMDGPCPGAS